MWIDSNLLHGKKDKYAQKQLENLGNRLQELHIVRGFSNYEQFAFDNNLPRAQYGRYENGQDLRFSPFLKVLNAMDISSWRFL